MTATLSPADAADAAAVAELGAILPGLVHAPGDPDWTRTGCPGR